MPACKSRQMLDADAGAGAGTETVSRPAGRVVRTNGRVCTVDTEC